VPESSTSGMLNFEDDALRTRLLNSVRGFVYDVKSGLVMEVTGAELQRVA
jgi:hypothetical protein